jgi:hypothetical protein
MKVARMNLELDAETAGTVRHLAENWGVSPVEAVRRAINSAATDRPELSSSNRLDAFTELQALLQLTPEKAAVWQAAIRESRR